MSDNNWHVVLQGKGQGPFPFITVQTMIKEGKVSKDALVWTPSMANWTCWREVPAFASLVLADKAPEPIPQPQIPVSVNMPDPLYGQPQLKIPLGMIPPSLGDYLSFKRMITPKIVNFFFWLGTVISIVIGLGMFIVSLVNFNSTGILSGFLMILIGPLLLRIYSELLIVFFRMNETLTDIAKLLEQKK